MSRYAKSKKEQKDNLHIKYVTIIDPEIGWFKALNIMIKEWYISLTWLKLSGCIGTLYKYKLRMNKDNNLLVMSS